MISNTKLPTPYEATQIIQSITPAFSTEQITLTQAFGRILAEDIFADRPAPAFNRVCMDGIAIALHEKLPVRFLRLHTHFAGDDPNQLPTIKGAQCVEVMTGAVLPPTCNCVIPYEMLDKKEAEGQVFFSLNDHAKKPQVGDHIHIEGSDYQQGTRLLARGEVLYDASLHVLATVGKNKLAVRTRPRIAVVATGSELVGINDSPKAWQIRASNAPVIASILRAEHYEVQTFHLRDTKEVVENFLATYNAQFSIIIICGGISMGRSDFIPSGITAQGGKIILHKIAQRPGKPFLFAHFPASGSIVFGLPGNPVSTSVCFRRYVTPYLHHYFSSPLSSFNTVRIAVLEKDISFSKKLSLFAPVLLRDISTENVPQALMANPLRTNGSGDFYTLSRSHGLLELPAARAPFRAGDHFTCWLW